ncbi:MAG TPA: cysteine desulfurase family protein [Anaerolineales bacterium]|nr:cysteine desulfurase family protein [Anaerolineales bacterium]
MVEPKIYFDYAATTPVESRVLNSMLPYFSEHFGNPSSIHTYGQQAESAVENARQTIATILNCHSDEVIFTSGGTESDNMALRGAALAARKMRGANHILTTPVEHHAILNTAYQLADLHGFEIELLPIDKYGLVDPQDVSDRLRPETAVVSIIYANNEIGTINPINEIGRICGQLGIPLHTDAVQATAYLPIKVDQLQVDLLSIGAHKFYGPKGVGVLFLRRGTPIISTQTGGGQELSLRAGTSNVPYIVGLAEALRISEEERFRRIEHVRPLRDHLLQLIEVEIPDSQLTGHPELRLPNHASFAFQHIDGNSLLMILDANGFACSSGSACKVGNPEPSDVLMALGLDAEWALGSLRITLGTGTTNEQIEKLIEYLPLAVSKARSLHIHS